MAIKKEGVAEKGVNVFDYVDEFFENDKSGFRWVVVDALMWQANAVPTSGWL